jgi:hypothetical protein
LANKPNKPECPCSGGDGEDVPKITGHTKTLRNPSQIDQIKKDMLDGEYKYDSPRGIISGVVDSNGVVHIGDGQHRVNAALEIFEETGNSAPLYKLIHSAKKGLNGRSYLPNGNSSWKTMRLPRRNTKSWWKFW